MNSQIQCDRQKTRVLDSLALNARLALYRMLCSRREITLAITITFPHVAAIRDKWTTMNGSQ